MLSTVLLMTWRERQERHVDDTQGNNTEREGNITDGRIQTQKYLEPLDPHQQAFSINSYTQVQKFNCMDSLGETSLMGCIH